MVFLKRYNGRALFVTGPSCPLAVFAGEVWRKLRAGNSARCVIAVVTGSLGGCAVTWENARASRRPGNKPHQRSSVAGQLNPARLEGSALALKKFL